MKSGFVVIPRAAFLEMQSSRLLGMPV